MKDEAENIDQETPDSAPGVDQTDESESSPDNGAEEKGSPSSEPESREDSKAKAPKSREQLIAALTTGKMDDDATSDDESEDPADETEAPEAATTDEAEPEKPAEDVPAGDQDAIEEEDAPLPRGTNEKTAQRFAKLLKEKKELKPYAEYGKSMFEFMQDSKLSPEDVRFVLEMGAEVLADPTKGALRAYGFAKAVAEKHGVKLPEPPAQQIVAVPQKLRDELDEMIVEAITEQGITPEVAKKIRAKLREQPTSSQPSPVIQPPVQTPPQQPAQTQQPANDQDARIRKAAHELATVQAAYSKSMPADWPKLKPVVDKAMGEKHAGKSPETWATLYQAEVEMARAKMVKPPVRPTPSKTLRPTTSTSPATATKTPRADILAELTGRKRGP